MGGCVVVPVESTVCTLEMRRFYTASRNPDPVHALTDRIAHVEKPILRISIQKALMGWGTCTECTYLPSPAKSRPKRLHQM